MTLAELNQLSSDRALEELGRCCGSHEWAERMERARPFSGAEALFAAASRIWADLPREAWQEAFRHHPRIGDVESLRKKFGSTAAWAAQEQSGAAQAPEEVLRKLAAGNAAYEARFGRVFLVCATGKSAQEMLEILERRLSNSPEDELRIAAAEQAKITRIRLEKLLA